MSIFDRFPEIFWKEKKKEKPRPGAISTQQVTLLPGELCNYGFDSWSKVTILHLNKQTSMIFQIFDKKPSHITLDIEDE